MSQKEINSIPKDAYIYFQSFYILPQLTLSFCDSEKIFPKNHSGESEIRFEYLATRTMKVMFEHLTNNPLLTDPQYILSNVS